MRKRDKKARMVAQAWEELYARKAEQADEKEVKALKKPTRKMVGGFNVGAIKGGR